MGFGCSYLEDRTYQRIGSKNAQKGVKYNFYGRLPTDKRSNGLDFCVTLDFAAPNIATVVLLVLYGLAPHLVPAPAAQLRTAAGATSIWLALSEITS